MKRLQDLLRVRPTPPAVDPKTLRLNVPHPDALPTNPRNAVYKIVPWQSGVWVGPDFTLPTTAGYPVPHGYLSVLNVVNNWVDVQRLGNGYIDILNLLDAVLYIKLGITSAAAAQGTPDLVMGPYTVDSMYVGNSPITILSNLAGYDYVTTRGRVVPAGLDAARYIQPRGPAAGIYVRDNNLSQVELPRLPHGISYLREYDMYDLRCLNPGNGALLPPQAAGVMPAGQGPTSITFRGSPAVSSFNIDAAGGQGLTASIQITTYAGPATPVTVRVIDSTTGNIVASNTTGTLVAGTTLSCNAPAAALTDDLKFQWFTNDASTQVVTLGALDVVINYQK